MSTARPNRLMEALDFTEADLEANRNGRLTERQRQLIAIRRARYLRKGDRTMLLVLGGFGIIVAIGWLILSRQERSSEDMTAIGAWVLAIFAIFMGLWIAARVRARGSWEWLANVDGVAQIRIETYRPHQSQPFTLCDVFIGEQMFRLETESEAHGFIEGGRYRVYYAVAPIAVLLSAEVLEYPGMERT